MRRTEIAVGIKTEQDAALEEDPENVALPIDRLRQPADDFKMRETVTDQNRPVQSKPNRLPLIVPA
jgi:hypothetical protein